MLGGKSESVDLGPINPNIPLIYIRSHDLSVIHSIPMVLARNVYENEDWVGRILV
jgi:hypothetical protein